MRSWSGLLQSFHKLVWLQDANGHVRLRRKIVDITSHENVTVSVECSVERKGRTALLIFQFASPVCQQRN
jgi:hypothetical protein